MPAPPPPAPAPEAAPVDKTIHSGVALRVGGRLQSASDPKKLDDFGLDELNIEFRFHGQLAPMCAWQSSFNAVRGGVEGAVLPEPAGLNFAINIEDLIGKFLVSGGPSKPADQQQGGDAKQDATTPDATKPAATQPSKPDNTKH